MKAIGEGRLHYIATAGGDTNFYNIAKDLAIVNARNEEITDRKGNLFGYWCKIETTSITNDILTLASVPNTWKVRNAVKRWHFARLEMFRDAGVTKREMGKYGQTLRPYMSIDHKATGDRPVRLWNVTSNAPGDATGGEWTYTKIGATVPYAGGTDTTDVDNEDMVDEYELTLLDTHDTTDGESGLRGAKYTTVGMVRAYVSDRMEAIPDATAHSSIEGLSNPLASLKSLSAASGEITEIAEDQQLEAPPYDIVDSGDCLKATFDIKAVSGTYDVTNYDPAAPLVPIITTVYPPSMMRSWGLYFFPAGLISLTNGVSNSNALEIEVVGKQLCKDVA